MTVRLTGATSMRQNDFAGASSATRIAARTTAGCVTATSLLRRVVNVINIAGLVAGGILAIAAAFTIANVIRLTMMLYREEIEIMRLVGATERIIRGPFLIEGFLQGTIGGLLAVVLLFASYETARRRVSPEGR